MGYENETVSVLVRIAPVGSISGRVFLPDGITALTTATVRLNNTPPTPVDTVTGIFRYDNLAAGQSYTLASFQPGTRRTGSSIATVNHDLEVVNGDITLCGIGVVGGTVFESDGLTPLPAAAIKLSFGGEQLTVYSDSNGSFSFSDIPTGSFTLSASHPLRSTGASQSGYLGGEGETITQNLVLGPIGSVRATVLLPDGVTPSRGGGIRISTDTGRILTGITDSSGQYTFTGIPVPCTISLYVEDAAGVGIGKAYGVLDHDGQLLDLGTTVLDDKPIFVTGINPAGGAVNVPVDQKMRVLFSEASDPDTVNNSSIFLALGSSRVDGTLQPDVDNSGVSFTPAAPLKGFTLYTLVVTDGVTDRAGRKLAVPQSISFMTMDTIPPVVTAVFPADGTLQVTADAVVRMTFSETVDPVSLNGIVLSSGGTPVSIRSDLIQNGTVVALTPLEPLGLNRTFTVSAAGVKDMAGNMMGGMAQAAFNTIDTIVPTVTAITVPSSADLIKGNSVPVTALVADNDVAFVDFYADDARIGTVSQAPYTHSLTLSHEGVIHLKAVAQDRVGNRGVPQTLELDVKVDMPPQIAIITPTDGSSVNTGGAIAVTVQWNDDLNLMEFVLTVSGELTVSQTIPVNGKSGSASFVLTAPAGITSTGAITIAVAARDSAGNVSKTAQRTVQLHDSIAPTITLASPGRDVKYKPGENAEVTITATDNIGLESIVCTADNAASKTMTFLVSPSVQSASRTFSFAVPNDAAPCATITVACSVRDRSGNSSIDTLLLTVADVVPPTVVSVTPAPGSTSVPVGSAVSVSFNEQIAPSSVTADLVSLTSIDGPVSGALSVASDGLTLTFKPYNQLGFARAYTFTLKAGVRDISGNAITSDLTVSFTTQRLDSDIVGYWPMDGDWSDYSGNGNHGTANGGVSFTSDRVVGTQAGSFDGVSGYVEIKNSSSLNPSAITVEAWVRSNASVWNSDGSLISKRDVYILHPIKDSREIRFFVFAGGNWPSVSCNDVNMDITKWHHYVSTYDGTVIKMYVDGVLKGTTNYSGSINTSDTGSLYVGWDDGISGRYFDGTIDEITIYKRALLPEDVLEHYNAGLTTNHTPPAAPTVDPVPLSTFSSQVVLRGAKESGSSIRVNGKQIVPHDAGTSWQALYTLVLGQNILDVSSHDPAGNISPAVSLVVDLLPINRKDPSIAGLWHMDGDWKDYSGNGNDLSGVNAIASSYDSPFPGMSAGFTGSASYLRSASGSRLPLGSSPRTISAWIKPYGYPDATYNGIFVYGPRNCNSATMLSIKNDGRLSTAFWCNDSYQTVGPTAPLNEWTHVAMTYDTGNKIGFYINGQLVQENTLSDTPVTQDGPIGIGATDDPGRFFNGLIDDVALYGRALGAQEILDIFNAKSSLSMVSPGQTQMYKPGDFGLATVSVSNPNGITKLYCNASGAVSEGTLVVPFDPPQTDVIQQFTFRVASNASPYALLHLSCIAETVAGTFGITDLDLQAADVTPAVVTGASIADNASGVAVTLPITVTFNKALLATSITSDTVQLRRVDSGAVVAGTIALSVDGTTITFTPALALDCSTSYHFVIQSVSDLVGNNSDYSIVFSTQTLVSPLIEDQGSSRVPYVLASGKYGTVTVSNSYVVVDGPVVADSISLSNSTITHYVNGLTGAEKLELAVAGTMSIDVASRIDVTGKGYLGSQGGSSSVGRTNGNTTTGGSGGGAGGSYGGYGGRYYYGYAAPNAVYGDPANPTEPGSGGGGMIYSYGKGGNGGGVVTIKAGILLLDGRITADGSSGGYVSGGGSGGGIRIDVGTLSGTGRISASGGWNSSNDEGGAGGGGRIAIYYGINTLPVANISAFGGKWYNGGTLSGNGGAGTIYLKDNAKTNPDLIVNYGSIATSVAATPVPGGDYDAVTVKGGAVLFMNSGLSTVTPMVLTNSNVTIAGGLVVSGDLILDNSHLNVDADAVLSANLVLTNSSLGVSGGLKIPGSMSMTNSYLVLKDILQVTGTISLQNGSTLTHESASKMSQWKLDITASSLSIDTTSKIDVTGRGYLSGSVGRTYGNSLDGGSTNYSGASYGGYGGGLNGGVVNAVYGDFTNPNEVGSGGGGYEYSSGDGGGLVRILTGNLALDGSIIADGQTSYYGGGSGGGIRIDADVLSGTGYVYARGGGSWYDFGAGGGGRIAVYYGLLTLPVANIVASGAASSYPGGAGTIYLKDNARPFADLIINNNGINSSSGSTPLTSIGRGTSSVLTYDSLIVNGLHWAPGALIGMRINPNINQSGFFKIVDNTTDTIFIDPAEGYLNQFATVGDSFSGVFALNSLSVLGKARLYTDEQFNVVGDAQIDNATVVAAELYAGRTLLTNGGLFEKR